MNTHSWSTKSISDPTYQSKFVDLVRIISEWTSDYFSIEGKDILDFGCGEATTALGMALQKKPRRIVGVEIQDEYLRCLPLAREQIGLDAFPENINLIKVVPGQMHSLSDRFDLIYSWSVFEHVEQSFIPAVLQSLRGLLKPNGLFFMQVAPLYYSAEGSHMKPWIPEPWAHLRYQHSVYKDMLERGCPDTNELRTLWSVYTTLNKVTADQLVQHAKNAGFEILRDYRTQDEIEPSEDLLRIFQRDVLITNQVVMLLRNSKG
jgi:cyclopropane fatty-acyl-phospholipid synthase-like methyltransferase